MYHFSADSMTQLATCHRLLVMLCTQAIEIVDFKVVFGQRTLAEQKQLVRLGFSKTMKSYHLNQPKSLAVDLHPCVEGNPIDLIQSASVYNPYFYFMAGVIKGLAYKLNIPIVWGGDWNKDGNFRNNKFNDLFHFQLDYETCIKRQIMLPNEVNFPQ